MLTKRKPILIRLNEEVVEKLKQEAETMGVTVNAFVTMALLKQLSKK